LGNNMIRVTDVCIEVTYLEFVTSFLTEKYCIYLAQLKCLIL